MPCPICDQKPANCDCSPEEKRQYAEIADLQDEIERLRITDVGIEVMNAAASYLEKQPDFQMKAWADTLRWIANKHRQAEPAHLVANRDEGIGWKEAYDYRIEYRNASVDSPIPPGWS